MECEILYVVVARKKKTVLCEYAQYSGNFQQISIKIITKLNAIHEKKFYSIVQYDDKDIYAFVDNEHIFLAIVDMFSTTAVNNKLHDDDDEWQDCSYYLYEFLYSVREELYTNYTLSELKQSHAYSLISFVEVLSASIKQYHMNKNQYKFYTKFIIGIQTCQLDYKKKNNESQLSIIKNNNQENEQEPIKDPLIEKGDKSLLNSVYVQKNLLTEQNKNKAKICQIVIIVCVFIAVILGLVGIVWLLSV